MGVLCMDVRGNMCVDTIMGIMCGCMAVGRCWTLCGMGDVLDACKYMCLRMSQFDVHVFFII